MDEILGYEYVSLYLLETDGQRLIPLAVSPKMQNLRTYERGRDLLSEHTSILDEEIVGWVAQHGQPIRSGNVREDPRYKYVLSEIQSELCIPSVPGIM